MKSTAKANPRGKKTSKASPKKRATKKRATKKRAAKPTVDARKPAASKTRSAVAVPKAKVIAATMKPAPRSDLGQPIDGFFARQPDRLRAILDELRALVDEAAPDADSSLKWGMPFYSIGGNMMCALAGFKAHVNLIMAGPPDSFADPDGRLEGDAKTGRHIKLRAVGEIPHAAVRGWLKTAAERARLPK